MSEDDKKSGSDTPPKDDGKNKAAKMSVAQAFARADELEREMKELKQGLNPDNLTRYLNLSRATIRFS